MSHETIPDTGVDSSQQVRIHNILAFHKLTDRVTFGSTNYSPKRLVNLLNVLTDSGFKFVPLIVALEEKNPDNVALTFDDGYAHLMQNLPRIIEKFNLKPTVFVPTAFIGMGNSWDYSYLIRPESHLSKEQIVELAAVGVEFGSHGHNHVDLTACTSERIERELKQSKQILEETLGHQIKAVSYPFGRADANVTAAAARAGYEYGFTISLPGESDGNHSLGRIPVYFFDNPRSVLQRIKRRQNYHFHLRLCRTINHLSRGTVLLNRILDRGEN